MAYQKFLVLPTKQYLKQFYEEAMTMTNAGFEMEYILSKLVEIIEEARGCRGESPASPEWQEIFVKAAIFEGLGEYHEVVSDPVFEKALRKLYGQVLTVIMHNDRELRSEDGITYTRHVGGDIILGVYTTNPLTPSELKDFRRSPTPESVPWKN